MIGKIVKVSGATIVATGLPDISISDIVYIGEQHLIGEILSITGDRASIQVYGETSGLAPGTIVTPLGTPMTAELGPGLLSNIYDGIQRPLVAMQRLSGHFMANGLHIPALDEEAAWKFIPAVSKGAFVSEGTVIGTVNELQTVTHKIMVPPGISGVVTEIKGGTFTVSQTVCTVSSDGGVTYEIPLMQKWPIRTARPYTQKQAPTTLLHSGLCTIDTLFPIARGGTATVSGPVGTGKTFISHQLAKISDADIVVYIGCGQRGNEINDFLMDFSEIVSPVSGDPLINRTIFIAAASDMPTAIRESAIYTGITIAEYFRDMGYLVAVIADSISQWAQALREISCCLEEFPGEEGYPVYLASRLAAFYERAGCVECWGNENRCGSITVIGTLSPAGGDITEPVTQAALRASKVFLNLDASLAHARHFPAINWLTSHSFYADIFASRFGEKKGQEFTQNRKKVFEILREEVRLCEIAQLIGYDSMSEADIVTLEIAKIVREDFLRQNASGNNPDTFSYDTQKNMLSAIVKYDALCRYALENGVAAQILFGTEAKNFIERVKFDTHPYDEIEADMELWIDSAASRE